MDWGIPTCNEHDKEKEKDKLMHKKYNEKLEAEEISGIKKNKN